MYIPVFHKKDMQNAKKNQDKFCVVFLKFYWTNQYFPNKVRSFLRLTCIIGIFWLHSNTRREEKTSLVQEFSVIIGVRRLTYTDTQSFTLTHTHTPLYPTRGSHWCLSCSWGSCLYTRTGTWEWWTKKSLTLPINVRRILPKPRDPVTRMSTFISLVLWTIWWPGLPPCIRITSPFIWKIEFWFQ